MYKSVTHKLFCSAVNGDMHQCKNTELIKFTRSQFDLQFNTNYYLFNFPSFILNTSLFGCEKVFSGNYLTKLKKMKCEY